jgi:histidinol-phosphate/aromatic aminotransferase/cobyric acid decarboxylase-like protein/CTP:molybdopterin cytidylyltransferase MocA
MTPNQQAAPPATQNGTATAQSVRRAVLLAAGRGQRLYPLTADIPKCLIEIGGEPLVERALRALAAEGVTEATIVVGYRGEAVRDRLGATFAGLDISYVEAPDYATTNNLRSLWDARSHLDQDVLLLDADVVFDSAVIAALLAVPGSSAAVAPHHSALSGTVVRRDARQRVSSFVLDAEQGPDFDARETFKTVNIYLLREQLLREQVVPRLLSMVAAGRVQEYYECILRDCVADGSLLDLVAVDVSGSRWYENDDHRDLDAAEFLFLDREAQFERIQRLHGGYWRYGFTDHSYLYNMNFPPQAMLDAFKVDLQQIVTNYPVAQSELARLVADWTGSNPEHVVVANGAAELIMLVGGRVEQGLTLPTPSFNEYEQVVEAGQLNRFALDPDTFALNVDAFADFAIRNRSDLAVVVTPNNPTAMAVPRDDLLELAARLTPHGCRLIVDESFIEFSRGGGAASVEGMVAALPNLAVIKSMSKVFGIAGLRLGYLVSADLSFVADIRRGVPIWNINGLAEQFLRTVGRFRGEFEASCDLTRVAYRGLYEDLLAIPGVEPLEPDANFVMCKLTGPGVTGPQIARRLYVEHNILIKDCAAKTMPDADRYVRIASRTPAENRRLVQALAPLV